MELSSPLRWLGAIAVMLIVVLIAGSLLINTLGNTVSLSSGASEEAAADFESPSAEASAPADDGADNGEDGGGDGGDGGGEGGGAEGDFPQEYEVAKGDTGAEISEQFYGNKDGWPAIAEANDIDPGAPLRVGEKLEIPAPE